MRIFRFCLVLLVVTVSDAEKEERDLDNNHNFEEDSTADPDPVARDYGHEGHETGYGNEGHETGYGHGGHLSGYEPHPPKKCHPQTITKYKTVYKPRKANVVNQVEFLNPRPHLKKVTETRYTTIRYPVFITQVIKPLLTQVETKVKPVFFTKTIDKYTTVLFTVTGIGQVTVTTVKYEKEYITRCMKKGGYHRSYGSEEGPMVKEAGVPLPIETLSDKQISDISPGHEIPYLDVFKELDTGDPILPEEEYSSGPARSPIDKPPRTPLRKPYRDPPRGPPGPRMKSRRRKTNRRGYIDQLKFRGRIGNVGELYDEDIYYQQYGNRKERKLLVASSLDDVTMAESDAHPALEKIPLEILE